MGENKRIIAEESVIKESTKKEYIPINIEVIEVIIEKGYAGSLSDRNNDNW